MRFFIAEITHQSHHKIRINETTETKRKGKKEIQERKEDSLCSHITREK